MPSTSNKKDPNNNSENASTTFQQDEKKSTTPPQTKERFADREEFKWFSDIETKLFVEVLTQNSTLRILVLNNNNISNEKAKAISNALKQNTTLQILALRDNNISDEGVKIISDALKQNSTLCSLDLYGNKISGEGAKAISDALKQNSALQWLNLNDNNISNEGVKTISSALIQNTMLDMLDLFGNKISDEGVKTISDALKQNSTLCSLDLRHNKISDEGAKALLDAFTINHSLCYLLLPRGISRKITEAIEKCLKRNREHRRLQRTTKRNSQKKMHTTSPSSNTNTKSNDNKNIESTPTLTVLTSSQKKIQQKSEMTTQKPTLDKKPITLAPTSQKSSLVVTPIHNYTQTLTHLNEDYVQGRSSIMFDLQRLEQQQSRIETSLKNIEEQLKKLQLTTMPIASNVNSQKVKELQKEIDSLKQQQAELLAEHTITITKRKTIESYRAQPNFWLFYRTFYNRLEAAFIGIKAGSHEFFEHNSHTKLNKTAKGITIIGKILSLIPAIGNTLDSPFSAVNTAIQTLDQERLENLFKTLSNLDSLANITIAIEATAHRLIEQYHDQFLQLLTANEASKQRSTLKKTFRSAKNTLLNAADLSPTEQIAEFAVSLIVSELLDGNIHWDQPLDKQFIKAINTVSSTLDKMKHAVLTQIGVNTLPTHGNKNWQLQDFYCKPGIKVKNSNNTYSYYANQDMDPDVYGYRLGTQEEVNTLELSHKKPPHETRNKPVTTQTTTYQSNTYSAVLQMMPTPIQSENLAHKKEVDKLKQTVDSEKALRQQHEDMMRQQQKEIEQLKIQLKKLQQTQGDLEIDVDLGDQTLLQKHQISQQSSSQYMSPRDLHRQNNEHDQRLRQLENKMHLLEEQGGEISREDIISENEEERSALLSESSSSPSSSSVSFATSKHFSTKRSAASQQQNSRTIQPLNIEDRETQTQVNCGNCVLI